MEKSIRVQVLGREYALRVREEDEGATREIAAYVDAKMRAFKQAHPDQPEMTAAIVTALAIAEELYAAREEQEAAVEEFGAILEEALSASAPASPNGTPARDPEA